MTAEYPHIAASDTWDVLHGNRIPDPFRRLEDLADPGNRAWVRSQRQLADSYLDALPGQDRLREVLRDIIVAGPTASPVKSGGARRFRVGRTHSAGPWQLEVADGPQGEWRTLLDAAERKWPGGASQEFADIWTTVHGDSPLPAELQKRLEAIAPVVAIVSGC